VELQFCEKIVHETVHDPETNRVHRSRLESEEWQGGTLGPVSAVVAKPIKEYSLTPKQRRFIDEYMIDPNATQAAIRAGYSKKTAKEIGCQLLTKLNIQEEIKRRQADLAAKFRITQEKIVAELAKLGFSNMGDYMKCTEGGDPYFDYASLTREQKAALEEVTVGSWIKGKDQLVKKIKFKLADKISALEKLGRHLGMFKEEGQGSAGNVDRELIRSLLGFLCNANAK
jgi:phage terminase small subunit